MDMYTVARISNIRAALATAGFLTEQPNENDETAFEVVFSDGTRLAVTEHFGSTHLGRVMPSGNVTATVVFTGMPNDVVVDAVVAMAKSLEA